MTRETFLFLLSIGAMVLWVFVLAVTSMDGASDKSQKRFDTLVSAWLVLNFVFFVVASCQLAASLPSGGAK